MRRAAGRTSVGIDALLASKEMVLVLGSGGVGKTTVAAALGLAAAVEQGGKVLVLTVDPARRLADALGSARSATPRRRCRTGVRGGRHRRRAASCGRRCSTPRPAGTTSSGATPRTPRSATRCCPTRSTRTSPAASCTATTTSRWSSSTSSTPRASTTSSSSTRRRRATPSRCSTRRHGWSSSSAAACSGGSPCRTGRGCSRWRRSPSTRSPIACSAPASSTTSPTSSCSSRRWRRASSRGPGRSRRCSATPARRSSSSPRWRRRPRTRLPTSPASCWRATSTSAPSSPTGCSRRRSRGAARRRAPSASPPPPTTVRSSPT